jgi:hypothetical protein
MKSWSTPLARSSLAAIALVLFTNAAAAQTALQYRFKKGEMLKFEVQQEMLMKMPNPANQGQEIKMVMEMGALLTWRIESVDGAGKAKLSMTQELKGMTMEVDVGMGKKEKMDLTNLLKGEGLPVDINALMGSAKDPFKASIDPQGEVADVQLPAAVEKMIKDAQKDLPKDAPPGALNLIENLFQGLTGPGMGQQSINPTGLTFPKNALAKGEKWRAKPVDVSFAGLMKITQTKEFTLDDPVQQGGKKLEKIISKDALTFKLDPTFFENIAKDKDIKDKIDLKDIKYQGAGKYDGYILFDSAAGRLVESQMTGNLEMAIEYPGMPAMKINMDQKVTIKSAEDK